MAVSMTSTNPVFNTYGTYGPQLLHDGKITMAQLNDAVRHVLTLKYLAGMFSDPYQGIASAGQTGELTTPNVAVARKTADESMVCSNNNNHALPLSPSVGKVAVVGPLGDDPLDQLGPDVPIGYDTTPADLKTADKVVTVADGIKAADPGATVTMCRAARPLPSPTPATRTVGSARRRRRRMPQT